MLTAYKKFWTQYADFSGRSSRSDFWWVFLINIIIVGIPVFIAIMILLASGVFAMAGYLDSDYYSAAPALGGGIIFAGFIFVLAGIYTLATLVPNIALGVRRLRDAGYHWAFIFLFYGPSLGIIIPLINYLVALVGFPCQIAFLVLAAMPTKEVGGYNGGYNQQNQYNQTGFQGQQFGQNQQNFQGQQFNQGQAPVQNQQFGAQGQQSFQGQPFGQNQQPFPGQEQQGQQSFGTQPQQPFQNQNQGTAPSQPFGQGQQAEPANPFNQAQQPFGQEQQQAPQSFDGQSQQAAQSEQPAQNQFASEAPQQAQNASVFGQQFDISGTQEEGTPQAGPIQSEPFVPEAFQEQAAEAPAQANEAAASEADQADSSETNE